MKTPKYYEVWDDPVPTDFDRSFMSTSLIAWCATTNFNAFRIGDIMRNNLTNPKTEKVKQEKQASFISAFNEIQKDVHNVAIANGWWDGERSGGGRFGRVHMMVSEALEAARKENHNPRFISNIKDAASITYDYGKHESDATLIALIHSELSEALASVLSGNEASEHIPEHSGLAEELADVVIRIMDMAESKQIPIAEAIVAKMQFNATRSWRHGNKQF